MQTAYPEAMSSVLPIPPLPSHTGPPTGTEKPGRPRRAGSLFELHSPFLLCVQNHREEPRVHGLGSFSYLSPICGGPWARSSTLGVPRSSYRCGSGLTPSKCRPQRVWQQLMDFQSPEIKLCWFLLILKRRRRGEGVWEKSPHRAWRGGRCLSPKVPLWGPLSPACVALGDWHWGSELSPQNIV